MALSSSDNGHIDEFIWTFSYKGKDTNLMGEIARFNFKYAGVYEVILVVTDEYGNSDSDVLIVTVLDNEEQSEKVKIPWFFTILIILCFVLIITGVMVFLFRPNRKENHIASDEE